MQSWVARAHQWCSSAIHCSAGQSVVITCMVQRVARSFAREQSDQGGRRSLQNDRSLGLDIVESEVVDGTYRLMSEAIRQCRGHVIRQSARARGWPVPPARARMCTQAPTGSPRTCPRIWPDQRQSMAISGNQWHLLAHLARLGAEKPHERLDAVRVGDDVLVGSLNGKREAPQRVPDERGNQMSSESHHKSSRGSTYASISGWSLSRSRTSGSTGPAAAIPIPHDGFSRMIRQRMATARRT